MIGAIPPERRYRRVLFEPQLLAGIIGKGTQEAVCDEQIEDLRVVAVRENDWRGVIEILVYSDSFAIVSDGEEPPIWYPSARLVRHDFPAGAMS